MQNDPVSEAKYRALRSVADRLLFVACTMLRNGTFCGPPSHRRPGPIPGNHPNNTRRHDIDTSA